MAAWTYSSLRRGGRLLPPGDELRTGRGADAPGRRLDEEVGNRTAEAGQHVLSGQHLVLLQDADLLAGTVDGHGSGLGVYVPYQSHTTGEVPAHLVLYTPPGLTGRHDPDPQAGRDF